MGALHFPETVLVESVKQGSHAMYRKRPWKGAPLARFFASARPQRIEFSRRECAKVDSETLEFVVWHELGHWFRVNHIEQREILGREKFLILGAPNSEEGFADAFAAHFLLSDLPLDDEYEVQKRELAKFLKTFDTSEIRSFADMVIDNLKISIQLRAT